MWGVEHKPKPRDFKIFVVRSINGIDEILETYSTGVREFAFVPLRQAEKFLEGRLNGYYIATDDAEIAAQYGIKLRESKYGQ